MIKNEDVHLIDKREETLNKIHNNYSTFFTVLSLSLSLSVSLSLTLSNKKTE